MSLINKRIANFEIIREIGQGGMGSVYLAKQMPVGREVAIKILPAHNENDDSFHNEAVQRFDSEAKAVSMLEHESIVSLYDYGLVDEMHFLAMQYVDGLSLYDVIKKRKPMPIETIIEYAKQICRGLHYAHEKGIIHRDIKPQNILVSKEDDRCRITDFGIAKVKGRGRVTMVGMAIGTPEYMSPEQAEGKNFDQRTDIYSLGILIYEMCTGNPPFCGDDPISVAYRQVNELPRNPSKIRHDIPVRLELIILKALKKSKSERYLSANEILKDLELVLAEGRESISNDYGGMKNRFKPSSNKFLSSREKNTAKRQSVYKKQSIETSENKKQQKDFNDFINKNGALIIISLASFLFLSFAAIIVLLVLLLK